MIPSRTPSSHECFILLRAAIWVWTVRLALWVLPFRSLRRAVDWFARTGGRDIPDGSASQFSWAVRVASQFVPKATCLTQAVALHVLLRRAGLGSSIRIGIAKPGEKLSAHAWVESNSKVLIGDCDLERYKPMIVWD